MGNEHHFSGQKNELVMRSGGPEDGPAIRALLSEVFTNNPKTDPAIMDWQFWKNPYGEARIWLWELDGRVVCQVTTLRIPVQIGGIPEMGASVVDVATHPSFRNRGLFTAMRANQRDEIVRLGVNITISFNERLPKVPRGSVLPTQYEAPARRFVIPLDREWAAARLRIPKAAVRAFWPLVARKRPAGASAQERADPPPDIDELWNRVAVTEPNGIRREGDWWRWRYGEHPYAPYRYFEVRSAGKLIGATVTREWEALGSRFTYLMELVTADADTAKALVNEVAETSAGSVGVVSLAIPGSPAAKLARASGFRVIPRRIETEPLRVLIREYAGSRKEVVQPWTVSWGDMDHL